jgi:hypothetical protein
MQTFPPEDLIRFLEAVDRNLVANATITVIGGGAAAIGYGVDTATQDIDTFGDIGVDRHDLVAACAAAAAETKLRVPLGPAGVADVPWEYESRRIAVLPHLSRLHVLVLERHDLVLSKLVRGYQNDMAHIAQLHALAPLDFATLLSRYLNEMSHVIGRPEALAASFLNCIDMLFGELRVLDAQAAIRSHRK